MRYTEILLEYDRATTIAKLGDKLLQKLRFKDLKFIGLTISKRDGIHQATAFDEALKRDKSGTLALIVSQFEMADPSPNKKFVPVMIRWYIEGEGGFQFFEDLYKVTDGLKTYIKFKNRIRGLDLNRVGFGEFLDQMEEQTQIRSGSEEEKAMEQTFYDTGQAELFVNNDSIKIVIPKTKEASIFFGRNTRWCTAARESSNMFNVYNDDGPLYIILFKKENRRWQFHFESASFMDEKDNGIEPDVIHNSIINPWFQQMLEDAVDSNPQLITYMQDPTDEELLNAVRSDPHLIGEFRKEWISDKICRVALARGFDCIEMMDRPNIDDWKMAVKNDPTLIGKMPKHERTEEMILAAISGKSRAAYHLFDDPSFETKVKAIRAYPEVIVEIVDRQSGLTGPHRDENLKLLGFALGLQPNLIASYPYLSELAPLKAAFTADPVSAVHYLRYRRNLPDEFLTWALAEMEKKKPFEKHKRQMMDNVVSTLELMRNA